MNKIALLFISLLFSAVMLPANATETVVIETSVGDIELELDDQKAPKSVDNFLQYAISGFYNGTIFHRVIKGFMVQGGGFTADYERKTTHDPITNEADNGLSNKRGTVAMARTGQPHSATSQFFINTVDNGFLDHQGKNPRGWGYAVFGKVTKGMDVVDKIENMKTGSGGPFRKDVPQEQIMIKTVRIVMKSAEKK